MPELPIVGTPDSHRNSRPSAHLKTMVTELKYVRCRNSRPSRHLKTSHWPLAIHTGHVRYDQDSELSTSVERETSELPTIAGTPDRRNSRLTSELPTNQPENNNFIIAGQIPDTSYIARPARNQLALLSLKHSKLTWVGLSTYKILSINMMHPS